MAKNLEYQDKDEQYRKDVAELEDRYIAKQEIEEVHESLIRNCWVYMMEKNNRGTEGKMTNESEDGEFQPQNMAYHLFMNEKKFDAAKQVMEIHKNSNVFCRVDQPHY